MKNIAIILCAGNQTRFNSDIPKPLVEYKGTTLLEYNINQVKDLVDYIFIVTSKEKYSYFEKFNTDQVKVFSIKSGIGSGDGIYHALEIINDFPNLNNEDAKTLLMWGDSIQNTEILSQTLNSINESYISLPVYLENKPYVEFKLDQMLYVLDICYSKNGDKISDRGFHDYCLFGFHKNFCFNLLNNYVIKYYNKVENNYNTKNKEFEFLSVMTEYKKSAKIFQIFNVKNNSFNTIEESQQILL